MTLLVCLCLCRVISKNLPLLYILIRLVSSVSTRFLGVVLNVLLVLADVADVVHNRVWNEERELLRQDGSIGAVDDHAADDGPCLLLDRHLCTRRQVEHRLQAILFARPSADAILKHGQHIHQASILDMELIDVQVPISTID